MMAEEGGTSTEFIHDVFLSFRGDTRRRFTDCLYNSLISAGINTFRDDPNLTPGDEISDTLLEAIEQSSMSIVVLSQNYASSTWCLKELAKIMECSDNGRQRSVIPIFYWVEPRVVRHQEEPYAQAMKNLESRRGIDPQEVAKWRSALSNISNLSGIHCDEHTTNEGEVISKIVKLVLNRRPARPLYINRALVPDSLLEEAKSLLDIESQDTTCLLVIHGDGETDMATFAGAMYNKIRDQFEAACFLNAVCEKSKESNGLEDLQEKLLSEMGEKIKTKFGSTFKGSSEIKQRLCHKRVLLVLQDVSSMKQLESLAGGADWFGPGSRIIVTTGDGDVANKHHVIDGFEIIKRCCIDGGELVGMEAAESNKKRKRGVEEEEEGDVVGLDDSLKIVINQLKEEDPSDRNVVCITGMGGLGKTTLAQKIYNNSEVKQLFPCRAWCSVSKDFSERKVLLDLLKCLKSSTSKCEDLSEEQLKEELRKSLSKNKYLVVLDDMWEPEVWDKVKYAFPKKKESMVLITSRNNEVAHYTRSRSPHHTLPSMSPEKSWELFCRKVFGREECPSHIEPIGKSIVDKCNGLPLAIVTIAGLLARKDRSSNKEWSQIEGFVAWHLAEDSTEVMDVLKVSYDNLPERLKPCFLYFGVFPEDHEIVARKLVLLWMAEGFIQPGKTRTSKVPRPEDVGDRYLDELVDRNLVQVVARRHIDGGVKKCRIHDLLRELCISESQANNNNFLEVCTESTNNNSLGNYHRLSFLCDPSKFMASIEGKQLSAHSLFFFPDWSYSKDIVKFFPKLNVLHVEESVAFDPYCCDLKMIHLKYMRIEGQSPNVTPCSWFSLDNLETLDLCDSVEIERYIGICIWNMDRLRHIYTSFPLWLMEEEEEGDEEEDKEGDEWKPIGLNLRTEGDYRKAIRKNLQTLSTMVVEPEIMRLINKDIFPNLTKLKLCLTYSSWKYYGYDKAWLWKLDHLSNLRTLSIDFCRERFSSFDKIVFPPNISKITLKNFSCVEKSGCMSALGRIPSLLVLKLDLYPEWRGVDEGNTLNCGADKDFPKLEVFRISCEYNLGRLTLEDGAMPNLRRVVLDGIGPKQLKVPKRLLPLCEFNNWNEFLDDYYDWFDDDDDDEEEEYVMLMEH